MIISWLMTKKGNNINKILKDKLSKKYGKPLNNQNINHQFYQLCKKAQLKKKVHLNVNNLESFNSTTWTTFRTITISRDDIKVLSRNELNALLAHEVGHIKSRKDSLNRQRDVDGFIAVILLFYFYTIYTLTMMGLNNAYNFILSIFLFGIVYECDKYLSRQNEYQADEIGTFLVDKKSMIHIIRLITRYQLNKIKEAKNLVQLISPIHIISIIECSTMIGYFYFWSFLQKCHLASHPTAKQRIKKIKTQKGTITN